MKNIIKFFAVGAVFLGFMLQKNDVYAAQQNLAATSEAQFENEKYYKSDKYVAYFIDVIYEQLKIQKAFTKQEGSESWDLDQQVFLNLLKEDSVLLTKHIKWLNECQKYHSKESCNQLAEKLRWIIAQSVTGWYEKFTSKNHVKELLTTFAKNVEKIGSPSEKFLQTLDKILNGSYDTKARFNIEKALNGGSMEGLVGALRTDGSWGVFTLPTKEVLKSKTCAFFLACIFTGIGMAVDAKSGKSFKAENALLVGTVLCVLFWTMFKVKDLCTTRTLVA